MTVNIESLNAMLRFFKDDSETLDAIAMALDTFESYHQAIYALEFTRRLYACGAMSGDMYRERVASQDATRTRCHNALLGQVNMLNRIAQEAGAEPFYASEVSEERPIRREVADAVLAFVRQVIEGRV